MPRRNTPPRSSRYRKRVVARLRAQSLKADRAQTCEQMARSLVRRGLASRMILDRQMRQEIAA